MNEIEKNEENKVEYPRVWEYCLFAKHDTCIDTIIKEKVETYIEINESKKNTKFYSKKVKLYVSSEEERNEIYKRLASHPEIKYII